MLIVLLVIKQYEISQLLVDFMKLAIKNILNLNSVSGYMTRLKDEYQKILTTVSRTMCLIRIPYFKASSIKANYFRAQICNSDLAQYYAAEYGVSQFKPKLCGVNMHF